VIDDGIGKESSKIVQKTHRFLHPRPQKTKGAKKYRIKNPDIPPIARSRLIYFSRIRFTKICWIGWLSKRVKTKERRNFAKKRSIFLLS